jgi:hypothetical protein
MHACSHCAGPPAPSFPPLSRLCVCPGSHSPQCQVSGPRLPCCVVHLCACRLLPAPCSLLYPPLCPAVFPLSSWPRPPLAFQRHRPSNHGFTRPLSNLAQGGAPALLPPALLNPQPTMKGGCPERGTLYPAPPPKPPTRQARAPAHASMAAIRAPGPAAKDDCRINYPRVSNVRHRRLPGRGAVSAIGPRGGASGAGGGGAAGCMARAAWWEPPKWGSCVEGGSTAKPRQQGKGRSGEGGRRANGARPRVAGGAQKRGGEHGAHAAGGPPLRACSQARAPPAGGGGRAGGRSQLHQYHPSADSGGGKGRRPAERGAIARTGGPARRRQARRRPRPGPCLGAAAPADAPGGGVKGPQCVRACSVCASAWVGFCL